MKVEFNKASGYVWVRLEGELRFADVQEAFADLMKHPEYDASLHRIWDISGATMGSAPTEEIVRLRELTRSLPKSAKGTKLAVVVSSSVDYGLGRVFQSRTQDAIPSDMNVFRSIDEAIHWVSND